MGGEEDPGEEFDLVCEADWENLGWTLSGKPPDEVWITAIDEDPESSWALYHELWPDDQLTKVNDIDISQMDKKSFKQALNERPVKLSFWRRTHHEGGWDPNSWEEA